ncbi:YheC/YheD family protein [Scopulibacillus cellulosilyticus]|uniref:YheC/YheD family protein n=1 Tax=Scopulibacillus cellulosilyticus TaxID=2665665 RepID=A0ABW2PZ06_9BACL
MDNFNEYLPLIGICVSEEKRLMCELVERRIKKFLGKANFIRFYIEDLDFEMLQVKGDVFEKDTKEWKEGIFPFPDAIYVQCHIDQEVLKQIEEVIGKKVFNNFIFDKWEGWSLLAKDHLLRDNLPVTVILESKMDLKQCLFMYQDIMLKPVDVSKGHSSRGIFRVKLKKDGKIKVFFAKRLKMKEKEFSSFKDFFNWFSGKTSAKDYIIQQSIQTVTRGENITDIRLNMNKNAKGKWKVSCLLFRVAANGSHMIPKTATALTIENLIKVYPQDKIKWEEIEKSIILLGHKICHVFEQQGYHMANLGIDLGLDGSGHLWIFEVNPLPFPLDGTVKDHSLTKPIEYALSLVSK